MGGVRDSVVWMQWCRGPGGNKIKDGRIEGALDDPPLASRGAERRVEDRIKAGELVPQRESNDGGCRSLATFVKPLEA